MDWAELAPGRSGRAAVPTDQLREEMEGPAWQRQRGTAKQHGIPWLNIDLSNLTSPGASSIRWEVHRVKHQLLQRHPWRMKSLMDSAEGCGALELSVQSPRRLVSQYDSSFAVQYWSCAGHHALVAYAFRMRPVENARTVIPGLGRRRCHGVESLLPAGAHVGAL